MQCGGMTTYVAPVSIRLPLRTLGVAVLVAGVAGLVAGAMSMAAGEYVSVHSQADTENADLSRERAIMQGAASCDFHYRYGEE